LTWQAHFPYTVGETVGVFGSVPYESIDDRRTTMLKLGEKGAIPQRDNEKIWK
jgi:hypothetical protein